MQAKIDMNDRIEDPYKELDEESLVNEVAAEIASGYAVGGRLINGKYYKYKNRVC